MADSAPASAACEWCGRAVAQNNEGRWYAVKGEERGYDPLVCDVAGDGRHDAADREFRDTQARSSRTAKLRRKIRRSTT